MHLGGLASNARPQRNRPGARRVDNRRVMFGIIPMLRTGGRWRDTRAEYGPHTIIYNRGNHNRGNRWCRRGIRQRLLARVVEEGFVGELGHLDSSHVKAHRSAHGGKRGARSQAIGPSRGEQTQDLPAPRRHRPVRRPPADARQHLRHPQRGPTEGSGRASFTARGRPRLRRGRVPQGSGRSCHPSVSGQPGPSTRGAGARA